MISLAEILISLETWDLVLMFVSRSTVRTSISCIVLLMTGYSCSMSIVGLKYFFDNIRRCLEVCMITEVSAMGWIVVTVQISLCLELVKDLCTIWDWFDSNININIRVLLYQNVDHSIVYKFWISFCYISF